MLKEDLIKALQDNPVNAEVFLSVDGKTQFPIFGVMIKEQEPHKGICILVTELIVKFLETKKS